MCGGFKQTKPLVLSRLLEAIDKALFLVERVFYVYEVLTYFGGLLVFAPADIGPQKGELFHHIFVPAEQMVHPMDTGFAIGNKPGYH